MEEQLLWPATGFCLGWVDACSCLPRKSSCSTTFYLCINIYFLPFWGTKSQSMVSNIPQVISSLDPMYTELQQAKVNGVRWGSDGLILILEPQCLGLGHYYYKYSAACICQGNKLDRHFSIGWLWSLFVRPEGVFYTLSKATQCLKAAHNQPKLNVKESVLEKVPNLMGD